MRRWVDHQWICLLAAVCVSLGPISLRASVMVADEFRMVQFVCTERTFERGCRMLDLTADRLTVARALYDAYLDRLQQINQAALEKGYGDGVEERLQELDEAFAARRRERWPRGIPADEFDEANAMMKAHMERKQQLTRDAHEAFAQAQRLAREALQGLFDDLRAMVDDARVAMLPRFERLVRRETYLTPSKHRSVIVLPDLIEVASEWIDKHSGESEFSYWEYEPLRDVLLEYETRLDSLLIARYERGLTPPTASADERERHMHRRLAFWRGMRDLNAETIASILPILKERVGPEGPAEFEGLYNRRLAPTIYATRFPDVLVDKWAPVQHDLSPEQRATIRSIYEQYVSERARLREAAIRAAFDALNESTVVYNGGPEGQKYREALESLDSMHERYERMFNHALMPSQRTSLKEFLRDHGWPW